MKILKSLTMLLLILFFIQPVSEAATLNISSSVPAEIAVDVNSGQVIAGKNEQERLPIASISKLIVVYLVEQAIQSGKLKHDSIMNVSSEVAEFSQNSNLELSVNKDYTIKQLEMAALIASSNGAAIALADKVCGTQDHYYKVANKLLSNWGIKNANIISSSGLNENDMGVFRDKKLDLNMENRLSAREVAKISWHLVRDYPQVCNITKQTEFDFPNLDNSVHTLKNTNELLWSSKYKFKGLKTGTTSDNGTNVVGYTILKRRPILTVVLNAPVGHDFFETENMIDKIKVQTRLVKLKDRQQICIKNIKIKHNPFYLESQKSMILFAKQRNVETKQLFKVNINQLKSFLNISNHTVTQKILFKNENLNDYLGEQPSLKYKIIFKIKVIDFVMFLF